MIKIFSTFSEDITYKNGQLIKQSLAGPAFYIKNVLEKNNINYKLYNGQNYQVKIDILENDEVGEIISKNIPQQKITDLAEDDNALISTIADEWVPTDDVPVSAKIFLDVQGYLRIFDSTNNFYTQKFWDNIFCLKGTANEINNLPKNIIDKQKEKILIITKGGKGCTVYQNNQEYNFPIKESQYPNTIGAGDTFLTNFFIKYLDSQDVTKSADFALSETTKFLSTKRA